MMHPREELCKCDHFRGQHEDLSMVRQGEDGEARFSVVDPDEEPPRGLPYRPSEGLGACMLATAAGSYGYLG